VKLVLVNPNTSAAITRSMVQIASEAAGPRAEVTGLTASFGTPLITDPASLALAARAVAAMAPALGAADAVIVAAFGEPGLDALRAALAVPVTGIAEAGMAEAARDGRRFGVVTTTPGLRDCIAGTAARYGHRGFAGTWTTAGDPAALTADPSALEAALAACVDEAIREGGAEAIVIGGGPLAVAARALMAASPVPLVEPVPAAVRLSLARAMERLRG
jgi:allantoin racemase